MGEKGEDPRDERGATQKGDSRAMDVDFAEIEPKETGGDKSQSMDFLLDIPLEITVELGRARIQIGELLRLGQGSVVEMERLVSDPVDIYVNHKLMAQGEVVVVNEKFGVRLTNIINPGERVKKLV
jgi:flagellar motor switch protein FliN/FliY